VTHLFQLLLKVDLLGAVGAYFFSKRALRPVQQSSLSSVKTLLMISIASHLITLRQMQSSAPQSTDIVLDLSPSFFVCLTAFASQWGSRVSSGKSFDKAVRENTPRHFIAALARCQATLFAKDPVRTFSLRASLFLLGMAVASIEYTENLNSYGLMTLVLASSILTSLKLSADIADLKQLGSPRATAR